MEETVEDTHLPEDDHDDGHHTLLGRVAVVGYPNVGKSTLVNRLAGGREAIVHETAGVTRDRKEIPCEWNGEEFILIDTGGIDLGEETPLAQVVTEQVHLAMAEADMILLIVDAKAGLTAADEEIADIIRTRHIPTVVVANKVDNPKKADIAAEFWGLALGEPFPMSAAQGTGSGDLLDLIVETLREHGTTFTPPSESIVRVGIFGRPNVGKSTMINRLLGEDRVIVSEIAGTTRDTVDIEFAFENKEYILVDTAGIQRKHKNKQDLQYYSEIRTLQAAEHINIALLLIDSSEGVTDADLRIADKLKERNCAIIVLLNKWDITTTDLEDAVYRLQTKLRQRPHVMTASGKTGRNLLKVMAAIAEIHDRYIQRITTPDVNKFLKDVQDKTPPPAVKGQKRLKIKYGTQTQAGPPKFRFFVNDRGCLTRSYGYYVENEMRSRFHFEGCPLIIEYRES